MLLTVVRIVLTLQEMCLFFNIPLWNAGNADATFFLLLTPVVLWSLFIPQKNQKKPLYNIHNKNRLCNPVRLLQAHPNPSLQPILFLNKNPPKTRLWPTDMY
jgi:hypothetical protein